MTIQLVIRFSTVPRANADPTLAEPGKGVMADAGLSMDPGQEGATSKDGPGIERTFFPRA